MKTLGEAAYEAMAARYAKVYGVHIPRLDQLPTQSQFVWEGAAQDIRALEGPFREVVVPK